MPSRDFVTVLISDTVLDAFRAILEAGGDVHWHIVVRHEKGYSAIQAGALAQAVIGRGVQCALLTPLRELSIPPIAAVDQRELGDPSQIHQLTLVLENERPTALIYEQMRSSFIDQINAKLAFDQLAAAAVSEAEPEVIPSREFIAVSQDDTVGDALGALRAIRGDADWYVIIRFTDHYGAIQADALARAAIDWGEQAALNTLMHDVNVPPVNAVPSSELSDPAKIHQLTVVLENDLPVLLYRPRHPKPEVATFQKGITPVTLTELHHNLAESLSEQELRELCLDLDVNYDNLRGLSKSDRLIDLIASMAQRDRISTLVETCRSRRPDVFRKYSPESVRPHAQLGSRQVFDQLRSTQVTTQQMRQVAPTTGTPVTAQETTDARARYVNTWFTDRVGGEPFMRERTLAHRQQYFVQLHIGPLLRKSIIVAPRPIDPDLPPIPDEGLLLRVKLFSRDFEIEQDTDELRLFRTGATRRLHFAVTPREPTQDARLRIGIYYQNNLVQSIMLHARVEEQEAKRGAGDYATWAEIEYSLSEDWADITQLQERRINIAVNESVDGTHTVHVVGTPTEGTLDIGRDKMKEAMTEFSARLLEIIMDDRKQYRYGHDNTGDPDKFVQDLKTLAYVGNALFRSVFYRDETMDFTRELRQALDGSQTAVIQIARLTSDFVFPWAGIYDRRLIIDRSKNQVCLEPLKQSTPQAALAACGQCMHAEDPNIICLAGFWGFRHIIEQPPGVTRKNGKPISIVRQIKTSGQLKTSVNVYVGDDFKMRLEHQNWLATQIKQRNGQVILSDELQEVKQGLPQPQQLCYFYCHGGSAPDALNPWLTVGKDERLMPSDLYGLGLEESWRFRNVRPLVFINACHSIEFTPEALSAFLPEFTAAGASGIIGTEISIFEPLAVEFGQGLIQAFLDGEPVGQAVQRLRWQLLLKRNVLGLVYTPYCYADLRLVQ